jgi:hypothetical protein
MVTNSLIQAGNNRYTANFQSTEMKTNASTIYIYSSDLMIAGTNTTNGQLQQNFLFASTTQNVSFSGIQMAIPLGSIKWSVNIKAVGAAFTKGINMSYDLTAFETTTTTPTTTIPTTPTTTTIQAVTHTHTNNLTTYTIVTSTGVAIIVDVVDVALVDGTAQTIQQAVSYNSQGVATLLLGFPPFQSTLEYDPVLSLALVETSEGGEGSSGSNVDLAVGLTVGLVGVAVLLVGSLLP